MSKSFSGVVSCSSEAPASSVARQSERPSPAGAVGLSRFGIVGLAICSSPTRRSEHSHGRHRGGASLPNSSILIVLLNNESGRRPSAPARRATGGGAGAAAPAAGAAPPPRRLDLPGGGGARHLPRLRGDRRR